MTEAERLQKIVLAQEKEIKRLRKTLSVVRVASVFYGVEDDTFFVSVTGIGFDEYGFTEAARSQLKKVAEILAGQKLKADAPEDGITGDPLHGVGVPQP